MMDRDITICIKVNETTIYEFLGRVNEQVMIDSANYIETLLIANGANRDKIQNVYELFVETVQNILNYSYNSIFLRNNKKEVLCNFSLSYVTQDNTYILESCNLVKEHQKQTILEKIESIKDLDEKALRQLIRKKSRSREDNHDRGAGLGYIVMARKSRLPIEVLFLPYRDGILQYKQRLFI